MQRTRLARLAAPLGLLLVIGAAAGAIASEALAEPAALAPLTADRVVVADPADPADPMDSSASSPEQLSNGADVVAAPLDPVEVPVPSTAPEPYARTITVVTPEPEPEPAPAATGGGTRRPSSSSGAGGGGSGGGGAGGGPLGVADVCTGSYSTAISAGSVSGIMNAVNQERARVGLPALSWSNDLAARAQEWSNEMAATGNFSHGGFGADVGVYGQNIYWRSGGSSADAVAPYAHAGWMKSKGHCENVLRSQFTRIGVAAAQAPNGAWYFTQDFA